MAIEKLNGDSSPYLAFNADGVADRGEAQPLLDMMKTFRGWVGQDYHAKGWGDYSPDDLRDMGCMDENGWVTRLPDGVECVEAIFSWGGNDEASTEKGGRYVIEYEGEGEIVIWKGSVVSSEPGRIVIDVPDNQTFSIKLMSTDPAGTGDYIRNMTMVREEYKPLFDAGEKFNPAWLEIVKHAAELRFMGWAGTNNSEAVDLSDRGMLDDATYRIGGVPVELMVELCNKIGADMYFNLPHMASDEYVRGVAEIIRDNLDPNLSVKVEYSNEAWNWAFKQSHYMLQMADEMWGNNRFYDYQTYRATQIADIFDDVFATGASPSAELLHVLGTRTGSKWITDQMLKATSWRDAIEAGEVSDPAQTFDMIGITSYFGSSLVSKQETRDMLIELIGSGATQPEINKWIFDKMTDPDYARNMDYTRQSMEASKVTADKYGMTLTAYEGGQHIHHAFSVAGLTKEQSLQRADALGQFNRSVEMAELYRISADHWASVSDEPYMNLAAVSGSNRYGSWGMIYGLDDVTPKWLMMQNYFAGIGISPPDDAHQHGVVLIGDDSDQMLVGTDAEDSIDAGGGDDIVILGKGDDIANGGAGNDVAVMSGVRSDYSVSHDGDVLVLTSGDGTARLLGFEHVQFSDGTRVAADLLGKPNDPTPDDPVVDENPVTQDPFLSAVFDLSGAAKGVDIRAVSAKTALGQALSDMDVTVQGRFAAYERGRLMFDGEWHYGSPRAVLHNKARDGSTISDDAVETALAFGSISSGVQTVIGSRFNDRMIGSRADDVFHGGAGNDRVFGRNGDDMLFGDAGNDRIRGGRGNDEMTGGAGADTFIFHANDGKARVLDFNLAQGDMVELAGKAKGLMVTQLEEGTLLHLTDGPGQMLLVGVHVSESDLGL